MLGQELGREKEDLKTKNKATPGSSNGMVLRATPSLDRSLCIRKYSCAE